MTLPLEKTWKDLFLQMINAYATNDKVMTRNNSVLTSQCVKEVI